MPSLTPTVLNRIPTRPASSAPRLTWLPRSARCMLHGLLSYQTLPMPTCGLARSSHERPVAISIACEAPWLAGWVMRDEYLFNCFALPGAWVAVVILHSLGQRLSNGTARHGGAPKWARHAFAGCRRGSHDYDVGRGARGRMLAGPGRPRSLSERRNPLERHS